MKLSIITSGKNDDYINFVKRMQHNLSKLNDNIDKLKLNDVEIIAVDWGSEKKLSDVMDASNFKFTKFIHVPPHLADKYSPDSKFSWGQSLNVGYRRSKGEYVFLIDGDSYLPLESFEKLYNLVNGFKKADNIFYWGSRHHLPYEIHSSSSSIDPIDRSILEWNNNRDIWPSDKVNLSHFGGTAMGILLSRNICEESTLFYEKLNKWGWTDIEIHNRISRKYQCCGDLRDLGMDFFHLDHHKVQHGSSKNGQNDFLNSEEFRANDDNWGLANESLEIRDMNPDALNKRISRWITEYLDSSNLDCLIVGISGGIDSALVSTLCARTGKKTIVVSMPIRQAKDQLERAHKHIEWLKSNYPNVVSMELDLTQTFETFSALFDIENKLALANSRSRLRMTALYQIAGTHGGIVVGTGNKIEDFGIGFFTKYGDGGVDISPIGDLNKTEVREMAKELGVIEDIILAKPTDGLWDEDRTDEDQIGATYEELEWAMWFMENNYSATSLPDRQMKVLLIFDKLNRKNRHKIIEIPVFKK